MAVNWAMGLQQNDPVQSFQQGLELGRRRQQENYLMGLQREQLAQQQQTREAQTRVGKHVAAGDLPGARQQAASSGNLDLVQTVNQMTAAQRAEAANQAQVLAPVYNRLRQLPYEQRRAELARLAPQLQQRGIPAEAVASYDPSDQNLESDISLAMTLEQQLARDRIDWQIIPQVGAFAVDSMGRPTNPSQMAGGQPGAIPQAQPPVAAPVQQAAPQAAGQPTAANGYAAGVGAALSQAGVPAPVVAGILGNGEHESGGRWNAAVGDNGTAHGAFQWRGERVENFQRITGAHPSQATPEQTAQFVMWELQNPQAAGMTPEQAQAILNARTPDEAARLFSRHYERPNRAMAHDDRRVAAAQQYAGQQYAGQQTAQAGPAPTPGQGRSIQDQAASGVIQAPRQAPPGYQWTPDGQLAPIPGGPGDQTYQRAREGQTDARAERGEVEQLVQRVESMPEVREFNATRSAMMAIDRLATVVPQGHPERAQHDMALIFAYMKALDPTSAVRETEYANASNAAGVPDRIRNLYNSARDGSFLSPAQRRGMVTSAQQLYYSRAEVYNQVARRYHPRLRNLGVSEPGEFLPLATGPDTERRRREQRQQDLPRQVSETARRVSDAIMPGTPTRRAPPTIRVIRRRPAA